MNISKLLDFLRSKVNTNFNKLISEEKGVFSHSFIFINDKSYFKYIEELDVYHFIGYIDSLDMLKINDEAICRNLAFYIGLQVNLDLGRISFEYSKESIKIVYTCCLSPKIVEDNALLSLNLSRIAKDVELLEASKETKEGLELQAERLINKIDKFKDYEEDVKGFNINSFLNVLKEIKEDIESDNKEEDNNGSADKK